MRVAVVIPAYNEERTIRDLVQRALRQSRDVIVVDDGSSDGTVAALADLPAMVLRHDRNQGKGAALWNGFVQALAIGVDAVVTMDGDGQHRPEDIVRLTVAAAFHPQRLIIAARVRNRERMPRQRRLANRVADYCLGWAAGHAIADSQSGQRLYPAPLLAQMSSPHGEGSGFAFESDILIRAAQMGYTSVAVPIEAIYDRAARPSHFRPVRDIWRIAVVVAAHLLASRMNLQGLWRSLRTAPCFVDAVPRASSAGIPASTPTPRQTRS